MTTCGIRLLIFGIAISAGWPFAMGEEASRDAPPVDMITPVPAPEIQIGGVFLEEDFKMPDGVNIRNMGGRVEGNYSEGWLVFGGPVKITTDTGIEIFANRARLDTKDQTVTLDGDVSIYQGNTLQRGARAVYHYERKFLDTSGLRASVDPLLLESGKFTVEHIGGRAVFTGTDAGLTTHDDENPNFWVRASETKVYPGDRITFRNLRLEAGGVPVFWLPYFAQPLDAELGYHFVPGARSNWGPYLLNTYGIMLGGDRDPATGENHDAWLLSRWKFDVRTRRGLGVGTDFVDTRVLRETPEITGLSLYYLYDLAPDITRSGRPAQSKVDENRYRVEWKHRHTFATMGDATWWADANLTLLSDDRYLDDFEPERFRTDPAPDNTAGVFRRDDHSLLSIFARLRVNDFYRADTRTPEIAFDQSRRPFFGLPILHEGTTSWAYLEEKAGDPTRRAILDPLLAMAPGDPGAPALLRQLGGYERVVAERISALPLRDPRRDALAAQLLDFGFARFHTYQELSMPFKVARVVNVTPQAGLGYTRYDSVDAPLADFDRLHLHFSTEASMKFTRRYDGIVDPAWGLDGINHVFQPYTQWSYLATDSTDSSFLGIDRLTPSTRPLPLDPLRFTAIDGLADWHTLRLGGRNRLLTRRDGQSHEWLYLDSFVDLFIDDPERNRDVSNLNNALRWNPLPWLGVDASAQFPIVTGGSGFNEYYTRLRLMPTPDLEIGLGYRILDGHPILTDSNRVDLSLYKRINENWGLGSRHVLEADDGTLEVQQYTVHRNLGNWIVGAGFTHRDNRVNDEYGVVFSITLKDFPSISLPFRIDAE
jgi:LPS-assembly protein